MPELEKAIAELESGKSGNPAALMARLQALMAKAKKAVATVCELGAYKGNPMFQIFAVNEAGAKITNSKGEAWAKFQFGKVKAQLIVKHYAEIKAFAESEGEATEEEAA